MQKKHHIMLYSLLGLCVVLAAAFAIDAEARAARYERALSDAYEGALLSSLTQIEQLRLNIDKALVSQDEGQSAHLISRIGSDASAVQSALSTLPLSHVAMADAVKLCNQLSDYADALLKKAGSSLDAQDAALLQQLSGACDELLNNLQGAWTQMSAGTGALTGIGAYMRDADDTHPLEAAAGSIEYPTLIYDGPFSDTAARGVPLGLGENAVTDVEAQEIALQYVGEGAQEAALTQESGGLIPAWGVKVTTQDVTLQLGISKQGGNVVWMFPETADFTARYGLPECEEAAEAFLQSRGYGETRLTFWQIYGGMATLSYAAVQDGAVLYPDLIKLQVRMDTLRVVGAEARHYLSAHRARENLAPAVTQEEAQGAVSERLAITRAQLCVIPLNQNEYLCWEFQGDYAGQTYYVYIDARTGRQRDIQRLVQSDTGPKAS